MIKGTTALHFGAIRFSTKPNTRTQEPGVTIVDDDVAHHEVYVNGRKTKLTVEKGKNSFEHLSPTLLRVLDQLEGISGWVKGRLKYYISSKDCYKEIDSTHRIGNDILRIGDGAYRSGLGRIIPVMGRGPILSRIPRIL